MKTIENKQKRATYVSKLMDSIEAEKMTIYINEANCNSFLRKNY